MISSSETKSCIKVFPRSWFGAKTREVTESFGGDSINELFRVAPQRKSQ